MHARLDKLLREALRDIAAASDRPSLAEADPGIERTRDPRHGDFTSNVALRAAKTLGTNPRELAAEVAAALPASELVERVEVAGPGFINFTLSAHTYREELARILRETDAYGTRTLGAGRRVLVEYVSANPTGPLHVGHGRHAAYGASIANLLRATGHEVHEEYYVNDAGRQMDILAASVWLRYAQRLGASVAFPPNAYQGEYVHEIAAELASRHERRFLPYTAAVPEAACPETASAELDDEQRMDAVIAGIKQAIGEPDFRLVLRAALERVLEDIRGDLEEFSVRPQRWCSEQSLIDGGAVERALDLLRQRDLLYEREGATWFRTSSFGDDKDRVVIRENGARTYFASDIAYHLDKRERGYDLLLDVLGADHHGYVARVRAGLTATGAPENCLEVRLVQFVVLYRGSVKAQMSTRSGEYVTLRELREEVGNDAARFFYVSRSNDQHLDFDLELAKSRSNDNPVYYVQYAHARVVSMLRRLGETYPEDAAAQNPGAAAADLSPLELSEERDLLVTLGRYPEVVQAAAEQRAPQQVVYYLRDLAAGFHSYYNAHRILVDDAATRQARVALALGVRQVIANALGLLGVAAPHEM